ncbi:MAG: hypothetical protein FJ023_00235 [Chloroflexi bacterium]|nr:hypothetical protein [Chloroflexota bacterium]
MKKLIPLLLLVMVVVLAGGCDLTGLTVTTTTQSPVISSFGVEPTTIARGESATLSWSVVGATKVSIDQGIGNVALSGRRAVMPDVTTVYTLMATNAVGVSVPATAEVIVTGAPSAPEPTPTPTPMPTGLPVVNYFISDPDPPIIPMGGSITFSWSVSNATLVTIDPGVGPVGFVGTIAVSPVTSTNYTLTASNAVGLYYMTIPVMVTGAPAAGEPDLIIEDISRSGDKISYKITNQGGAAAGPSTSTLLVDTVVVANDNVGSVAPGESKTETFTLYTYNCTLPGDTAEVRADTGGAVTEASEANNSYAESWSCLLVVGPMLKIKFPDLVIEDIWVVPEITGDIIHYRIKNQGGADCTATTTTSLFKYPCATPCFAVASDSVLPLAAGASREEKFAGYKFSGTGGIFCGVKVEADKSGAVVEESETNNSLSKDCTDL